MITLVENGILCAGEGNSKPLLYFSNIPRKHKMIDDKVLDERPLGQISFNMLLRKS